MTNMNKIWQELRLKQGQQYQLIGHFEGHDFKCSLCGNRGQKGYELRNLTDEHEVLRLGESCMKERFLIQPQEPNA